MRKFKTAAKNRANYVYYTAEGKGVPITPDDVGDSWIAFLHKEDDSEVDAERREGYHAPIHYDAYSDGDGDDAADRNGYLGDGESDPLENLIRSIDDREHEERLDRLNAAIRALRPRQIELIHKIFYENRAKVDIAAEEGVSEAAIRNRLKKIYENLRKKI